MFNWLKRKSKPKEVPLDGRMVCTSCKKATQTEYSDEDIKERRYYDSGWRIYKYYEHEIALCPACVSRRAKQHEVNITDKERKVFQLLSQSYRAYCELANHADRQTFRQRMIVLQNMVLSGVAFRIINNDLNYIEEIE